MKLCNLFNALSLFAVVYLLLLSPAFACPIPIKEQTANAFCIDMGGYQLYMHTRGEQSPVVVFESGAGKDSSSWDKVMPTVAQFARTITYDRAGLGKSQPRPGNKPNTPQYTVNTLYRLLQKEQIKPPYILVGQAEGGHYMQLFAAKHPQEVVGVVLVNNKEQLTNQQAQHVIDVIHEMTRKREP